MTLKISCRYFASSFFHIKLAEPFFYQQCSIPVFEGLFPTVHDRVVQSLLYRFAQWHALAKLRIHSESTVTFLQETFKNLSQNLRKFRRDTCDAFNTMELPKERAARQRRVAQRSESSAAPLESSGAKTKKFNLETYKFHSMGDYVRTIKLFGTTDSFTTQTVCICYVSTVHLKLSLVRASLHTGL